jgi:hypothetical protein
MAAWALWTGVHDRPDVVRALVQGGRARRAIRETGAALVEADQPTEAAEPLEEPRKCRPLPLEVEMRGGPRRPHEVHGSVPADLVGDQHVAAPGVVGLRRNGHVSRPRKRSTPSGPSG